MAETIVTLKKGEGRTIKSGGAWIYDNEIDTVTGHFTNGSPVSVHDFDGYPMGTGFINQNSKIRIRMLSRDPHAVIDRSFLRMRLQNAWDYRKAVMGPDLECCRLVFGEADWLPGLVVDRYRDLLVVECLALGMDLLLSTVLEELLDILSKEGIHIRGIFERSDAPVRKKEGLFPRKRYLYEAEHGFGEHPFDPRVEITENGVRYLVDVENGQKTGFFLDQKHNRMAMQKLIAGLAGGSGIPGTFRTYDRPLKVLDCFTHMGTFALNCGLAGAADVTGLDISEYAVAQATANASANGLSDRVRFRAANVLDELPKLAAEGELYDVVILDPPAFTKSKEATKNAIKGYREINMKGLKLVRDGGYLATCSCSHFMTQELFTQMLEQASKAVHKRLRQVEFRTQAPDHPILWAADQSYYLKFYIFQVVDEK